MAGLPKSRQLFVGLPSTTAPAEQVRAQHPQSHLGDTQALIPHKAKARLWLQLLGAQMEQGNDSDKGGDAHSCRQSLGSSRPWHQASLRQRGSRDPGPNGCRHQESGEQVTGHTSQAGATGQGDGATGQTLQPKDEREERAKRGQSHQAGASGVTGAGQGLVPAQAPPRAAARHPSSTAAAPRRRPRSPPPA